MAAGRHGGYRSSGFRERGADFRMPKKEIGYHRDDFVRIRTGEHDYYRSSGRTRDSFDYCGRLRQKDTKERQVLVNGGRYPSACSRDGGSGCGSRRCDVYPRNSDREPGELSSDGSDGSDIQVKKEADKMENGSTFSPLQRKKRKFSPVFWDKEDRAIRRAVMDKNEPETTALLPPPPPTTISSPTNLGDADHSVDSSSQSALEHHTERSPSEVGLPPDLSDFPSETSQLEKDQWVDVHEGGVIDDDNDDEPDLTIISSRWATDANSPVDDGEISVHEDEHKWRRMCGSDLTEARGNRKSISPELGEIKREGSVETNGSLTGSHLYNRSSSRDNYHDNRDTECRDIDDDRKVYRANNQSRSECEDGHSFLGIPESGRPLQRSANMLQGCRSVDEFERLNKIDEGTYGIVYRAKDKRTGEIVALKKVKMEKEREGFPLTALREINILLSLNHPCIVDFKEVVVGSSIYNVFIVMEYMEHDFKALMETMKQPFSQSEVKCLMLQLFEGIKYLHDNWVLHRDLKTSNLLLNNRGELKICDFGLARHYGSSLKPYTQRVVTLWYRSPELLLDATEYSTAVDMWSLGCIMAELLLKEPLFNGNSVSQQLDKIHEILGTPTEAIWPGLSKLPGTKVNSVKHMYKCNLLRKKFPATPFTGSPVLSDAGFDLLNKLLTYDPDKRITAEEALNHEWFREVPLPKSKEFMPTFPARHAQDRHVRRLMKSPDPLEELRIKELQQGEIGSAGLFGQ